MKHLSLALALILAPALASAEDTAPKGPQQVQQAQEPFPANTKTPDPQRAIRVDMSRSVTLTGHELQALIQAQVAQQAAQNTAAAAKTAAEKVQQSLSAPAAD